MNKEQVRKELKKIDNGKEILNYIVRLEDSIYVLVDIIKYYQENTRS